MPVPCQARCMNQRNNECLLDDERINQCQVEFGEEWDPEENCVGYLPRKEREASKRRKR